MQRLDFFRKTGAIDKSEQNRVYSVLHDWDSPYRGAKVTLNSGYIKDIDWLMKSMIDVEKGSWTFYAAQNICLFHLLSSWKYNPKKKVLLCKQGLLLKMSWVIECLRDKEIWVLLAFWKSCLEDLDEDLRISCGSVITVWLVYTRLPWTARLLA